MSPYFRPLRRKIGIATLVMACVFAAGLIRSGYYADWGFVQIGDTFYLLQSEHGGFTYHKWPKPPPNGQWFGSHPHIALLSTGEVRPRRFFISYSIAAMLLTVLSAWLLLSKPRAKSSPESS